LHGKGRASTGESNERFHERFVPFAGMGKTMKKPQSSDAAAEGDASA
jgi:hypothetical protein